jgi:hypothetical protein
VKTYVRSTMNNNRLSSLALIIGISIAISVWI